MKQKSFKAKTADAILTIMQTTAIVFGFIFYIQLVGELFTSMGVNDADVGTYVWAITIGLMVLAGWAFAEKDKA